MQKGKRSNIKASYYSPTQKLSKVNEPLVTYTMPQFKPIVKDFNYKEFKKIADKIPFTQKEWSDMLHISERTLQRYAKDNGTFNFSVVDRILQIDKVVKKGVQVFGSIDKFLSWIKDDPQMLEGRLSFHSLTSIDGIQRVLIQLGRIEHGLLA